MLSKEEADKIKVDENTPMGFVNCHPIVAEDLPKWAYRRLESWPELLDACKMYQERIELFRKMNPDIIIKLGSGLGLTQAEEKGKDAIAKAEN